MFEVTGQGGVETEMRQQFAGDAGIFRGNEAGSPENTQGARTEVFQITDGGGDEIEGALAPIKPQIGREGMRENGSGISITTQG